jgi:3-phenylpropionate/trans-cinnamate dioxygenase ferredoxin subunit
MDPYHNLNQQSLEYIPVGRIDELQKGERLFVEIDGLPVVIIKIADQYFAIADVCSHDDGPVGEGNIEGYEIICPRHGARFDLRTGKALSLPAFIDIPVYPVRVVEDQIEVGIPNEK